MAKVKGKAGPFSRRDAGLRPELAVSAQMMGAAQTGPTLPLPPFPLFLILPHTSPNLSLS